MRFSITCRIRLGSAQTFSVGSGSNDAEEMDALPAAELAAFEAKHALGATWGEEENRAVAASKAWLAEHPGEGIPHEEILREFGLSPEDLQP